jgi:hypothetical protein
MKVRRLKYRRPTRYVPGMLVVALSNQQPSRRRLSWRWNPEGYAELLFPNSQPGCDTWSLHIYSSEPK